MITLPLGNLNYSKSRKKVTIFMFVVSDLPMEESLRDKDKRKHVRTGLITNLFTLYQDTADRIGTTL